MEWQKPLDKGTTVKYMTKICRKETLQREGLLDIKEENGYVVVDCFVAGDSFEKGLSIVCLENPEICMTSIVGSDEKTSEYLYKARKEIRETGAYKVEKQLCSGLFSPRCGY